MAEIGGYRSEYPRFHREHDAQMSGRFRRNESQRIKLKDAESQPFCFRSRGLVEITKLSKDLRQNVPGILDVEVDPNGGPRVQEAAMKLYAEKDGFERIHLVQGLQAIEMGVKRFYYSYKQLLMVVMGSLEAGDSGDSLDQVFLEPTYFSSLDAAKTFLAVHRSM
nr:nematode resistance protein-like HSPRO2 [Ipomoea batatas]